MGAGIAGLLLRYLRWSAPLLPPLLLTAAIVGRLWHLRSGFIQRVRDAPQSSLDR